jgi:hypothetical protein
MFPIGENRRRFFIILYCSTSFAKNLKRVSLQNCLIKAELEEESLSGITDGLQA